MRVLVLGAGFGGLEITTRLAEDLGDAAEITLIDRREGFVFGFSKLDVMFGRTTADHVFHPYADIVKPGVTFAHTDIRSIDPNAKRVETDAGTFEADALVLALGADLHPEATPGLLEGATEFYTNAGAFAAREVLDAFEGGRVIVGVCGAPYKCPPAPSETALLMHDLLVAKGVREQSSVSLVLPLPAPVPPSPDTSRAILDAFAACGIDFHPSTTVASIDADRRVAVLADGDEMPFDLFLAVPRHVAPAVLADSGLLVDGWIPVDPYTLETSFPGVYAVGDCTSVGTPKAGVFAERQGGVVADALIAASRGATTESRYDGTGTCYIEFGHENVARVDITFAPGQPPHGTLTPPSSRITDDKAEFGASRIRRWFGREWRNH
jgi:sulfide:quinone oxidoreductase